MGSWRNSKTAKAWNSKRLARFACWPVVVLLVGLVLTTGCLENGQAAPISASEAVDRGTVEARAWAEDARLVLASGMEAPAEHPATEREMDEDPVLPADENVGDGLAPAWTLLFFSEALENTRSYHVTGSDVVDLGEAERPGNTPEALPAWEVDSPDAMGVALEDDAFREAVLSGGSFVVSTLALHEGDPAWMFVARTHPGGGGVDVMVHAVDGAVLGEGEG